MSLFSGRALSPSAVKDAIETCADLHIQEAEQASLRRLNGEIIGERQSRTLFVEADGVFCHLQHTKKEKAASSPPGSPRDATQEPTRTRNP